MRDFFVAGAPEGGGSSFSLRIRRGRLNETTSSSLGGRKKGEDSRMEEKGHI